MLKKIETGSQTIFRYDNLIDLELCNNICQTILASMKKTNVNFGAQIMPWHDQDTFLWSALDNQILRRQIAAYRTLVANIVTELFGFKAYPEFTDLVLWRKGRKMLRHQDNGYKDASPLRKRKVSSITYLNDDYTGGETFIRTENGNDYISYPRAGSFVCFLSDATNAHGVNEVRSGNRITLPIWFCSNEMDSEDVRWARANGGGASFPSHQP